MKFSLYSEIQSWPGKPAAQLYGEVLEQIQNADRLGYDAYAVIEHFFFPKFSISASPLALFAAAAQKTKQINFRTLLHSMPYHNPVVLASEIAVADILLDGRYEFGVGRGHGWMPPKAGIALTPESRERYEESVELLFTALENERFSYDGKHFQIADSGIVPRPAETGSSASSSAAPPTARTSSRPSAAGPSSCRRCSRTRRSPSSSTSTAPSAPSTGPSRTSSGSTPATSTRTVRSRSGRPRSGWSASSRATPRR